MAEDQMLFINDIPESALPEGSVYLGTYWERARYFDETFHDLIIGFRGEIVTVKIINYKQDGTVDQWGRDYYGLPDPDAI